MCVLSYYPTGEKGFIITSNRDENIAREKALAPKKIKIKGLELYCPIDPQSQGTWIGTSKNYSLVLLNGGYVNHQKKSAYKKSRGQIILDFLDFNNPTVFFENYDFNGLEPFTLVIINNHDRQNIFEVKWCNEKKYMNIIDGQTSSIWSSATLYDEKAINKRSAWFSDILDTINHDNLAEELLHFHENGGKEDLENSIKLKRSNGIETVCITQIEVHDEIKSILFKDLILDTSQRFIIY